MFKECWEGKKEEVTLTQISSDGFSIILDWMYTGRLPDEKVMFALENLVNWDTVVHV